MIHSGDLERLESAKNEAGFEAFTPLQFFQLLLLLTGCNKYISQHHLLGHQILYSYKILTTNNNTSFNNYRYSNDRSNNTTFHN